MGSTEEAGPVQVTGETWEVEKLYVMDASVFPTSLGINPMVSDLGRGLEEEK
jgi:long-chain-alcohol oxidase